jgi:hypothetical protein
LLIEQQGRDGVEASDSTVRPGDARGRTPLGAAPLRPEPPLAHVTASKGGLLKGRERTTILFSDAAILTETPPLRACWAKAGEQAEAPIKGDRAWASSTGR